MRGKKSPFDPNVKFWPFVQRGSDSECWPFLGVRGKHGYGHIYVGEMGRPIGAHRISWTIANSAPIPPKMLIMHTCDNPPCVNPAHLRLATNSENQLDMVAKGRNPDYRGEKHFFYGHKERFARGERCASAKLTSAAIVEIRNACKSGQMYKDIAKLYGVCPSSVSLIARGKRWAHIDM